MSKKTRAERNLKFETLQLHVGQENPESGNRSKSSADLSDIFFRIQ